MRPILGALAALALVAAGICVFYQWKPVYATPVRPLPAYVRPLPATSTIPGPMPSTGRSAQPMPD